MNEISLVGWFHTIAGTLAIFIGIYLISKFKVISSKSNLGTTRFWGAKNRFAHHFLFQTSPFGYLPYQIPEYSCM